MSRSRSKRRHLHPLADPARNMRVVHNRNAVPSIATTTTVAITVDRAPRSATANRPARQPHHVTRRAQSIVPHR